MIRRLNSLRIKKNERNDYGKSIYTEKPILILIFSDGKKMTVTIFSIENFMIEKI